MRKFIVCILSLLLILPIVGCGESGPSKPKHEGYVVDQSRLFGMDEPLYEKGGPASQDGFQVKGFDLDITVDLLKMMGAKSFRFRIPNGMITSPTTVNEDVLAYLKDARGKLVAAGVTHLIGSASLFPAYTSFSPDSANSVPRRDDPSYQEWLNAVSDMWEALVKLLPEITYWEMGNESNVNTFFHPNGYIPPIGNVLGEGQNGFNKAEQAAQVADYLYYAHRGIKKGNPDAVSIMPGLSPGSGGMTSGAVKYFMEDLYANIKSGDFPFGASKSRDSDDYFMVLGWHPYVTAGDVDDSWLQANNDVYEVVKKNGDNGKKVVFTEFGFTDYGDEGIEARQSQFMQDAVRYCQTDMKYVETLCAFRLYESEFAATWGGAGEVTFGYFREPTADKGFSPKQKAFDLQKLFGGTGDLTKYE